MFIGLLFRQYIPSGKCNSWRIGAEAKEECTFPSEERVAELGAQFLGKDFLGETDRFKNCLIIHVSPKIARKKLEDLTAAIRKETK